MKVLISLMCTSIEWQYVQLGLSYWMCQVAGFWFIQFFFVSGLQNVAVLNFLFAHEIKVWNWRHVYVMRSRVWKELVLLKQELIWHQCFSERIKSHRLFKLKPAVTIEEEYRVFYTYKTCCRLGNALISEWLWLPDLFNITGLNHW